MNDYWLGWRKYNQEISGDDPETNGILNRILMSFSIKRTCHTLFYGNEENSDEIESIHGIKTLATIALFYSLKLIPLARVPFTNRIYFTEVLMN